MVHLKMKLAWRFLCFLLPLLTPFFRRAWSFSSRGTTARFVPVSKTDVRAYRNDDMEIRAAEDNNEKDSPWEETRRFVLLSSVASLMAGGIHQQPAWGAPFWPSLKSRPGAFVVETRNEMSDSLRNEQVDIPVPTLSSEYALLKVLPVKNPVFRSLEHNIESVSALRKSGADLDTQAINSTWAKSQNSIQAALALLLNKRAQLEPVFNPEDSTEVAILKAERGEILIEQLREELCQLSNATSAFNSTRVFQRQEQALITLGFIGELLVKEFPYRVPKEGKFSFLPRLLGRATVTLRIKRNGAVLGNITIVADGYTAPITAGNFVDLCLRNFYNGLPVKAMAKRFPTPTEVVPVPATINVLGSFNEGFFDPLTAKLRRIPLEVIRLEKGSSQPKLSYSTRGSPDVLLVCKTCLSDMGDEATFESANVNSQPLLRFETPGLVALNHPTYNPNGGSSEFFALCLDDLPGYSKSILDGEYAPFGYIIRGWDLYQQLKPEDVIDATFVDDFGQLNLVKIRQSNFKDAASASESENM